jgi:hypothetical protein
MALPQERGIGLDSENEIDKHLISEAHLVQFLSPLE